MEVFNLGFRRSWLICIIIVVHVVIVDLIEAHIICFSWKLYLNFLMKRWRKINDGTMQIMKYIKILSRFSVYFLFQPDALRRGYVRDSLS